MAVENNAEAALRIIHDKIERPTAERRHPHKRQPGIWRTIVEDGSILRNKTVRTMILTGWARAARFPHAALRIP